MAISKESAFGSTNLTHSIDLSTSAVRGVRAVRIQ